MSIQGLLCGEVVVIEIQEESLMSPIDYLTNMVFESVMQDAALVTPTKIMYGTKAYHQSGNLSRDSLSEFVVTAETGAFWVGHWKDTDGQYNVLFPKKYCQEDEPEINDEECIIAIIGFGF